MKIPLIDVLAHRDVIGADIDKRVADVIARGQWIMGPEVGEFEKLATEFVEEESLHAIGCGNGTDALVLALQAFGLSPGEAVICPAFTFVATAESIALLGGVPVFAEVEDEGFNVSAASVRAAAVTADEAGLEVRGICAVDLFGVPANYVELEALASELDCWLLADGAQSFGATFKGQGVGAWADVTTASFFPAKPLGCYGDGGMVFTRDDQIADLVRSLRVHGKGGHKYENVRIGQNSRLDTIQAAVLIAKLEILADELNARQRIADRYEEGLSDLVVTPTIPDFATSAWAQYTITSPQREVVKDALTADGIASAIYYPKPLHQQSGYSHFHLPGIDLSRTELLASQVLSLPMHPYLRDDDVDRVVSSIRTALTQ